VTARTLPEDLRAAAAARGERIAVAAGDRRLTYAELDRAVDGVAAGLHALGVRRGDRVAIVLPNGLDAVVAIYGALRAGAAFLPLNPSVKADKLAYVLNDSGAETLICSHAAAALADAACAQAPCVRRVIGAGGRIGDVASIGELAAVTVAPPAAPLTVDLAAVIYTSGSTGRPKGVTLSHANMAFAAGSIVEYLGLRGDDRLLCVLPLSFDYGLYQLLMSVRVGATLLLEPGFAFAGRVVELLERERITVLPGVPTLFQVLTSLRGLAERRLPHLRLLTNTGAALTAASIESIRRTFPEATLFSMYGLTECKRVSYLPPEQLDTRPTSVGVPIPGTEAWIVDEHGDEVGPGEVGELVVRGSHVMQGYWGDERATAARLRPGRWPWERVLATGDLFRRDAEGYLFFVGRLDDIIKSRGEKVAPREVEEVLAGAPGVGDVAVIGVPDRLLGQAVHAHVCAQAGHDLDPAALRRHCALHLEEYMVPQRVVVHDELPKSANGKIDRRALAEAAVSAVAARDTRSVRKVAAPEAA
jgi:amino acid adenylation domain-containing protein